MRTRRPTPPASMHGYCTAAACAVPRSSRSAAAFCFERSGSAATPRICAHHLLALLRVPELHADAVLVRLRQDFRDATGRRWRV